MKSVLKAAALALALTLALGAVPARANETTDKVKAKTTEIKAKVKQKVCEIKCKKDDTCKQKCGEEPKTDK